MDFLNGKKTYILGSLGVVWAVYGWAMGYIQTEMAQGVIWASLTSMAMRAGVAKK